MLFIAGTDATWFSTNPPTSTLVGAMADAAFRFPVDLIAYCIMPNHFHILLSTQADGDLERWMQ